MSDAATPVKLCFYTRNLSEVCSVVLATWDRTFTHAVVVVHWSLSQLVVFNRRWLNRILLKLRQIGACLIYRTKQDSMTTMCLEQNFVVTKCNVHVFILAWLSYLCVGRMEWHLCSLQAIVVTIGRLSSFWKQGPILTYKTRWEQHELLTHCISFWTWGCGQISVLGLSNMAASDTWLRKALGWYWVDHFFSSVGLLAM